MKVPSYKNKFIKKRNLFRFDNIAMECMLISLIIPIDRFCSPNNVLVSVQQKPKSQDMLLAL